VLLTIPGCKGGLIAERLKYRSDGKMYNMKGLVNYGYVQILIK